jgi:VanZ family protein
MNTLLALRDSSPLRFGLALGYTLFVIIILVQPTHQPMIDLRIARETPSMIDQLWFGAGHMLLFLMMALLWLWAFYHQLPLCPAVWLAFSVTLLIGVGSEIGQFMISSRDPSIFDLAMDTIGTSLPLLMVWLLRHRHEPSLTSVRIL